MLKKRVQQDRQYSQRGVVSIFVVIFSALLITIVTVGFVQLMVRNQQEASTADLSESAYDSAMAGVEDAKRAIVRYNECASSSTPACDIIRSSLDGTECSAVAGALGANIDTYKGTTVGGGELNQAYTCAKLTLDTIDYVDELLRDSQHLVPLRAVGGSLSTLEIEWAGRDDADEEGKFVFGPPAGLSLPAVTGWPSNRPAIIEVQLIQLKNTLDEIDNDHRALTLYPVRAPSPTTSSFSFQDDDIRKGSQNGPRPVFCQDDLIVGNVNYSCRVQLSLPVGADPNRTFLRIATRYNNTNYRLSMFNASSQPVQFDNVQPEVDVTGRASDVFRRVSARITAGPGIYPEAAVDISGNLCKTFFVTGHVAYYDAGTCTP